MRRVMFEASVGLGDAVGFEAEAVYPGHTHFVRGAGVARADILCAAHGQQTQNQDGDRYTDGRHDSTVGTRRAC